MLKYVDRDSPRIGDSEHGLHDLEKRLKRNPPHVFVHLHENVLPRAAR
jgi:hypothetical protein